MKDTTSRTDDITEIVEAVFLDEQGNVIAVQQEQRTIRRWDFLIREMNRIAKRSAHEVTEARSPV